MPATYDDVKEESIKIIDEFAVEDEVAANYLKPPASPKYSAKTSLASLGINAYVRKAITKSVSYRMRCRFGDSWKGVGASDLKDTETRGAFIRLMSGRTGVPVTFGEPT